MPKKFFYVCAGLFLLALSYHFGARGASAQGSMQVFGSIDVANVSYVANGTLVGVHLNFYTGIDAPPTSIPLPHPGTVVAATCTVGGAPAVISDAFVVYEDGVVWQYTPDIGWRVVTSMTGEVPTPATGATWGQVKDRYRK